MAETIVNIETAEQITMNAIRAAVGFELPAYVSNALLNNLGYARVVDDAPEITPYQKRVKTKIIYKDGNGNYRRVVEVKDLNESEIETKVRARLKAGSVEARRRIDEVVDQDARETLAALAIVQKLDKKQMDLYARGIGWAFAMRQAYRKPATDLTVDLTSDDIWPEPDEDVVAFAAQF